MEDDIYRAAMTYNRSSESDARDHTLIIRGHTFRLICPNVFGFKSITYVMVSFSAKSHVCITVTYCWIDLYCTENLSDSEWVRANKPIYQFKAKEF